MKSNGFYILTVVMLTLFWGCEVVDSISNKTPAFTVDEINIIEKTQSKVVFELITYCASACITNQRFKIDISDTKVLLFPLADQQNPFSTACPQICNSFTNEVEIVVPRPGIYRFEFIGRNDNTKVRNIQF